MSLRSGKYHFQTAVPDVKGAGVDKTAAEIAKPPAKPASETVKKTVESQSVQVPVGKVKTQQPLVALTFDDGPDPLTLKLLDLLKTRNAKATKTPVPAISSFCTRGSQIR